MSSRDKHGLGRSVPNEAEVATTEAIEDVVLIIQGKQLKTNSNLLAQNSPTFADMINLARMEKDYDTEVLYDGRDGRREGTWNYGSYQALRIHVPEENYSDMKTLLKVIHNFDCQPNRVTGDQALKIMPLVAQYKMKRLRKTCAQGMIHALTSLREKHGKSGIPISEILKYLSCADQYKLTEVKALCLEECSGLYTASIRESVVKERHVSEKCKTQILNMMCDRMQSDYDTKLKEIREEMDREFIEIEKKRKEFMDVIRAWKADLRKEVDAYIKDTKESHAKLEEVMHQEKITSRLNDLVSKNYKDIKLFLKDLREEVKADAIRVATIAAEQDKPISDDFWQCFDAPHRVAEKRIEIALNSFHENLSKALHYCEIEGLQICVQDSFAVQEKLDVTADELARTIKRLSEAEANYQREKAEHERNKVELMKLQRREHQLNTWIKVAKPPTTEGDDCTCFRHSRARQVVKT